jgi:plastocyanin
MIRLIRSGGRRRRMIAGFASSCLLVAGVTAVTESALPTVASADDVHTGPFTIVAKDYAFNGVPDRIKAFDGLTQVTMVNESTSESHEIVFVRLKDLKKNKGFNKTHARARLVRFFNFEAQDDPLNVGGKTPGFASVTNPGGIRDAGMGGRADVFRDSFGGEDTHEVEAVLPLATGSNGIDFSRPGRYMYFCPITAKALNDPNQQPHYLQQPGQLGFLQVVDD